MSDVTRLAFQIERVKGKFTFPQTTVKRDTRKVYTANGEERLIPVFSYEHGMRVDDEAFMVYFPQGHSLCFAVDDVASLERYGLTRAAEEADMTDLLTSDERANLPKTPKQIVEARLARSSGRTRTTIGLDNVEAM